MRQLIRRLLYLLRRRRFEADLAEELAFHRTMKQRELEAGGLESATAGFAARRALGSMALAQDRARDVWIWPWFQDLSQDFRFAGRLLARDRWFTLVAVIALGLGIGVNNTQFTIVNAICLRGLPISQPDRVLYLTTRDARDREAGLSYRDFEDWQSATRAFSGMAAMATGATAIGDDARAPDRVVRVHISADAFRLIGEEPVLGRNFRAEDDRPGAAPVVMLGSGIWKRRYGGDAAVIGRTVRVGGVPSIVIGVMPDGFRFPYVTDLWQPVALMPGLESQRRDVRTLAVFGRLAATATVAQARAELSAIASSLAREYPDTNSGIRPALTPINERYSGKITDRAWMVFTIVGGLVVLIACANVANLLLMRSARRSREIAVRASLGATQARIVRQLLVESAVLATLGGFAGLGLSHVGIRAFARANPENGLPYWATLTMDGRVFAVLLAVCVATIALSGLAPAVHLSNTDVNDGLKEGGPSGASVRVRRWTAVFLTLEFALTVILLASVVLGARVSRAIARADTVVDASHLMTMWLTLPNQKYPTGGQRLAFFQRLTQRLDAISLISSASAMSALPFGGATARQLDVDGRPLEGRETPPMVWTLTVDSRYFRTMGLRLAHGRDFTDLDGTAGHESAIVNQRFADMHFRGDDPIGRRIRLTPPSTRSEAAPWLTIVGTSPTVRQRPFPESDPVVYVPFGRAPPVTAALAVRTRSDPAAITSLVREEIRALDADTPLYGVMTMEQLVWDSGWNGRLSQMMITTIAGIALLLAAVGLYAVTTYAVTQRTREIGVRIALGARSPQVVWLVLRRVMVQLSLGLMVGAAATWIWGRLFDWGQMTAPDGTPHSYRITDPETLGVVAVVIAAVGLVAAMSPARRATRLHPVAALRYDG